MKTLFTINIFGLRDRDGEVQFMFPPHFAPDRILTFMGYSDIKKLADASELEECLVEVVVSFGPTGKVTSLSGAPKGNVRPHYIHGE